MKTLDLANKYKGYLVFSGTKMLLNVLRDLGDVYFREVWCKLPQNNLKQPFNMAYLTFSELSTLEPKYLTGFIDYIEKMQQSAYN